MSGQLSGQKRKMFGLLDTYMERFLKEMLAGHVSVDAAAEAADIPTKTAWNWLVAGHPVRVELERRVDAKRRLFDAMVALVENPKASPYTKLEAYREVQAMMGVQSVKDPRQDVLAKDDVLARLFSAARGRDRMPQEAPGGHSPGSSPDDAA